MPTAAIPDTTVMNGNIHDATSIAVIGVACRFPGDACNPERFWEMLCEGRSAYSESNRYNVDGFHSNMEGKLNTSRPRGAHFLQEDVGAFDANFFTMNESEAIAMDPQARIMLEVAYESFENAGLPLDNVAGTKTSCYVGVFTTDYREMLLRDPDAAPRYGLSGSGSEMISNRLSWFYDLRGASFTLGTACSSSLVALHQGCQSLLSGDADMSIVGGCNLLLNPDMFLLLSNMQFLAQDGRCKSFDAKGDGYGRGEGFGAVILKRVDEAIRDGDPIRAVIRGTGVNQDGHTKGITVPNPKAQADLIRSIYDRAGLDYGKTHYVESHGTGTRTGDPLELEAISNTLGSSRQPGQNIMVGSVKPNIGHLEAAAGLAGLIKAIYILEQALIPPNILFNVPNPRIPFREWKISVPTKLTQWPTSDQRRISVQGFGYGGTNAHVVLDDTFNYLANRGIQGQCRQRDRDSKPTNHIVAPGVSPLEPTSKPIRDKIQLKPEREHKCVRIFVLSSHDRNGLKRQRESLAIYLKNQRIQESCAQDQLLRDLAFTLSDKRSHLLWRTYGSASSLEELRAALETEDSQVPAFRSSTVPRLGFVFTGQGAQWPQMGMELNRYPTFRKSIEKSEIYLGSALGCTWSATEEMRLGDEQSQINNPAFAQPLCTILQIALVDLLEAWNVVPSAVVGHSSGEIAAAYCLGALTREDALKAAYYRGLLTSRMKELAPFVKGAMLAVGASESQAQDWISELGSASGQISIACINSPSSVTLSGDVLAIDKLLETLKSKGVFARKLKVETAYHSQHMNVVSKLYLESLDGLQPKPAHESCRMYSAVTGFVVESSELGPMNWVRNLVSPVLFYDALYEMLQPSEANTGSVDVLLELGPHSTLQGAVEQTMAKHSIRNISYLPMLIRGRDAVETGLASTAALFAQGYPVNLNNVNMGADHVAIEMPKTLINLPPYAWNHSRTFWAESRVSREYRLRKSPRLSLLGAPHPRMTGSARLWKGQIRVAEQPWIRDHRIQTSILYPGAGYLAMVVEAAAQIATEGQKIEKFRLKDIQIVAPAVMNEESDLECVLEVRPHRMGDRDASSTWMEFSISSCHNGEDLRENCFGLLQVQYETPRDSSISFEDACERRAAQASYRETDEICDISEDPKLFYDELASIGLNYGPAFRNLTHCRRAPGLSSFTIAMLNPEQSNASGIATRPHILHPTNLDSMFHGVFAALKGLKGHLKDALVPTSIREIEISAEIPFTSGSLCRGFCKASEHGFRELMADLVMFDENLTTPTVTVKGFHCSEVSGAGANATDGMGLARTNIFSKIIWKPAIELLLPNQLQELLDSTTCTVSSAKMTDQLQKCELQAFHHIQRALHETSIDQVLNVELQEFYGWMRDQDKLVQDKAHPLKTEKADFPNKSGKKSTNGSQDESLDCQVIDRIGTKITPILHEEIDVKQLVLEDDLLGRWLSELLGLDECWKKVGKYIDLLAHSEPALSILEIGASTKGAVPYITSAGSTDPGAAKIVSRYVFSRPTDAELEKAKQCLGSTTSQVEFMTLALDRDPASQGFSNNAFDIIICSSIDPFSDPDRTLANVRQLLKPSGKICMIGITNPDLRLSFVLHAAKAKLSERSHLPIGIKALEGMLARRGLATEFFVPDFESPELHHLGLIIATSQKAIQNGVRRHEIVILEPPAYSREIDAIASQLSLSLESHMIIPTRLRWGEDVGDRECICLIDLADPLLENIDTEDFTRIQSLVSSPSKLIWVASASTPAGALAIGMARSIRNEVAGKQLYTLSVQEKSMETPETLAQVLTQLVTNPTKDSEFLEEDGLLKTCRVVEDPHLDAEMSLTLAEKKDRIEADRLDNAIGAQKLAVLDQGTLDSVCLETDDIAATGLADDEVEIEVRATGLNFRDVMVALGQIPDRLFGFDASGVVARVGKDIRRFKTGDRVCTLGHGTHRTRFRNKADFCQAVPDGLTFHEAATLPLVHCTAYHALINIAHIRPGETILIHAAAGGVGQAAIQLAKHFGLEIFATVGSAEKRARLQESFGIPEDHMFNSRDLSFAKGVLRMTSGRGVDCVLNSLSGQALQETWRCIAPFGTFVEIGLKDIMENTGLEMRPFAQDATFSFLNLKRVMTEKPKLMAEILEGTFNFLRKGVTRPITPVTVYPISAIEDAMRLMQTGRHSGKIAITWAGSEVVPILHRPRDFNMLNPDATYVLCGGLGGLGQSLASLLVRLGARNICFISRSGRKSKGAENFINKLELQNIKVQVYSCDISINQNLARTLQDCSKTMPPIKGVIQCAMVLRDVSYTTMSHSHWTESLRPKVQGTWNLHLLTPTDLDFFITLSSFAAIFGNRTQSNYAAAGAFQDALAHYRTAGGLKAVTIDLGIMRDVGVIAERGVTGSLKEWEKPFGIREEEFHLMMTTIIKKEVDSPTIQTSPALTKGIQDSQGTNATPAKMSIPPQVLTGFATGGAAQAAGINTPFYFSDPRFSHLAISGLSTTSKSHEPSIDHPSDPTYLQNFTALALRDPHAARSRLTAALIARVAKSLLTDPAEISDAKPLHSYGVDSLVAIEIATWLFRETKVTVTVFDVSAGIPIKDFAAKLVEKARAGAASGE